MLKEFPVVQQRPATEMFPPHTLVVTDRPDLLAGLGALPADLQVVVNGQLESITAPVEHVRVVTTMGGMPSPSIWDSAERLIQLHNLTFLALQKCHSTLTGGNGSFISLFLDSVHDGCLHPFAGLFSGLTKCAAFELSGCLTFALFTNATKPSDVAREVATESTAHRFLPVVAYENGVSKAMFLEQADAGVSSPARIDGDSVVVAIAGARGITAEILKTVAKQWRPKLYLIGSNPIDSYPADIFQGSDEEFSKRRQQYIREEKARHPKKNLGTIDKEFNRMADARAAKRNISEMAAHCGAGRVHYVPCNVLDGAELERALGEIHGTRGGSIC